MASLALVLCAQAIASPSVSASAAPADTPVNLITNGGFEQPVVAVPCPNGGLGNPTPGICSYLNGSTGIPGWTVGGDSVDVGSTAWEPADGNQSVDLSGGAPGSLTQTVTTVPGTEYTLTWFMAGGGCGQAVKTMHVSWDGTLIDSPQFDTTGHTGADMGWVQLSINVQATGTSSTVEFADATPDGSFCGATLDDVALIPAAISSPAFFQDSPLLSVLAGVPYSAVFSAAGSPAYSLADAPAWLSVNQYGAVTGTPPGGTASFSYSVQASNADGSAVAGPYTVQVQTAAAISGTVTDGGPAATPVAGTAVQACVAGTGQCQRTVTAGDGSYSVLAPAGATVIVIGYALPGSNDFTTAASPLTAPADGVTGESIALTSLVSLPAGVTVNGTSSPAFSWASPATVSATGCTDGLGLTSVIGENMLTAQYQLSLVQMAENPVGSGSYSGTIPPLEPVHGGITVDASIACLPQNQVVPGSGPTAGGSTVEITGSGFTGATGVTFGGVAAASFTVLADQDIEAVAPPGTGTVPVTVQVGAQKTAIGQFTYMAVQSVSPASGPAAGGTPVVITGTGLGSAEAVFFGGTAAAFTQVSDTEIDATSPAGTGTADVTVETLGGQQTAASTADQFTYSGGNAGASRPRSALAAPSSLLSRFEALAAARALPTRPARPGDSVLFPSCSDSTVLYRAVIDCLSNIFKKNQLNLASIALAVSDAVQNPTCANTAAVVTATVQAAAQSAIQAALTSVQAVVIPAFLLVTSGILYEIGGFKLIAATGIAAYFYTSYWVQSMLGKLVKAVVNWTFDKLGCPTEAPNAKIDPSGTVFDTSGNPVSGATVTISRADSAAGPFLAEAADSPDIDPNVNPETTAADGAFHWDVVAGWYEVSASAPGCTAADDPFQSTVMIGPYPVPPPQLGLTITLDCPGAATPPAPAVSGLSVPAGPPSGGTQVTVLGSNFTPASTVTFGNVAAASVTYLSGQALEVQSPAGAGLQDVRVQTQGGTSPVVTADRFFFGTVPAVSKVSPSSGPATGGSVVTITGTGFTGATEVSFGGLPAASFTVKSATTIQAVAPASLPGSADVQVANPVGVSPAVAAGNFRYRTVTAYVATTAGVVPLDAVTGQAGKTIAVRGATSVAVTPNGATVYAVSRTAGTLTPVKVATAKPGKAIKVGKLPSAIAITPDGASAYVVNSGSGTVTPVKVATGKPGKAIKVGTQPDAIVIAPDGRTAYVASATGTVTPISLATGKAGKAFKAGKDPVALAISANGATLYVADFGTAKVHGTAVLPITLATGKQEKAITVGSGPDAIALTPGGLFALVASYYAATVTSVRLSAAAAGSPVKVASKPTSIAVTP